MPYSNPPIPWADLERLLSDGTRPTPHHDVVADGGDGPAFSRKRAPFRPQERATISGPHVPYAELHAHSHYSFLDGASAPESLIAEAAHQRVDALALTDHDGLYGAVRFAEAAQAYDLSTCFGAELSLGLPTPQNGIADPQGQHLLAIAKGAEGYRRLCGALRATAACAVR